MPVIPRRRGLAVARTVGSRASLNALPGPANMSARRRLVATVRPLAPPPQAMRATSRGLSLFEGPKWKVSEQRATALDVGAENQLHRR